MKVLLREWTSRRAPVPRVLEPDLVMDDPEKVAAYTRAGRVDGVMAPVYLHHCLHVCEVVRPGDRVVDLACGPATQLAQVAALNPEVEFIGIDLSAPMLERARAHIDALCLDNVRFQQGTITDLAPFPSGSIDAAMSTMALHHLPDTSALSAVFRELDRILKPDAGVYLVDFGRLRNQKSIDYFAHQYADRQPELFTLDYLYSLRAAFSVGEVRRAAEALGRRARLFYTFGFPMMLALKSAARRQLPPALLEVLRQHVEKLPRHHRVDFRDLTTFFALGGLRTGETTKRAVLG